MFGVVCVCVCCLMLLWCAFDVGCLVVLCLFAGVCLCVCVGVVRC